MSLQICPKCKECGFTWHISDESPLTIWECWICHYRAYENEARLETCDICNKKTLCYMTDEHGAYWWCPCGNIKDWYVINIKSKNTIVGIISKQDREAWELLQKLLARPGMYVGSNRFDYIDYLFSGYCMGRKNEVNFMPDAELQYWLLHTQSVSLHSNSISGRSLFYRCFGSGDTAFKNYKEFICAELPKDSSYVSSEIFSYEVEYGLVYYDWTNIDEEMENDIPSGHHEKLAQFILENIREMIARAGFICEKLKIYVHKESLFTQIRFLFFVADCWIYDNEIISKRENHELLIALHANARNTTAGELRNCGCDVIDTQNYNDDYFFSEIYSLNDEKAFFTKYLNWKDEIITKH